MLMLFVVFENSEGKQRRLKLSHWDETMDSESRIEYEKLKFDAPTWCERGPSELIEEFFGSKHRIVEVFVWEKGEKTVLCSSP